MFLVGRTVLKNLIMKTTTSLMYMGETLREHVTGISKQQPALAKAFAYFWDNFCLRLSPVAPFAP